ncbi:MAG: hypothetical protein RL757_1930 [Bacteroidota bacterium]|jgi:hypothetical protein
MQRYNGFPNICNLCAVFFSKKVKKISKKMFKKNYKFINH